MAIFWAGMIKLGLSLPEGSSLAIPLILMGKAGIGINAVLMVLNLLPLPPLDGGRIAVSLLPPPLAYRFASIEPYGMIILVVLLFSGMLGPILTPLINLTTVAVASVFGF